MVPFAHLCPSISCFWYVNHLSLQNNDSINLSAEFLTSIDRMSEIAFQMPQNYRVKLFIHCLRNNNNRNNISQNNNKIEKQMNVAWKCERMMVQHEQQQDEYQSFLFKLFITISAHTSICTKISILLNGLHCDRRIFWPFNGMQCTIPLPEIEFLFCGYILMIFFFIRTTFNVWFWHRIACTQMMFSQQTKWKLCMRRG